MNFVDIYQKYWKNGYTLTDLSLSGIDREVFRSLFNPIAEVFRKYPAGDAHLYIPGVGQVAGLQPGNYFDSAGTMLASVDGSVGLVLDAAGSVGAELLSSGLVGATTNTGSSIVDGVLTMAGAVTGYSAFKDGTGLQPSRSYRVTATYSVTGNCVILLEGASTTAFSGTGVSAWVVNTPASTPLQRVQVNNSAGVSISGTVTISIKEVTGNHAIQSTPGYKPTERRGIVNVQPYSNDLTVAGWNATNLTKAAGSLTRISTGSSAYCISPAIATPIPVGSKFTVAVKAKAKSTGGRLGVRGSAPYPNRSDGVFDLNTGTVIGYGNGGGFTGTAATIAGPDSSGYYMCAVSGTVGTASLDTVITGPTDASLGISGWEASNLVLSDVYVAASGIFRGTLTAQQILDAGGIPITTTAPASSQAGVNYLEFDGVDDRLSLGAPLFQMADDHCVVAGVMKSSVDTSSPGILAVEGTGTDLIGLTFSSAKVQYFLNAGGTAAYRVSTFDYQSTPVVATGRKIGTSAILRVNGVQQGSALSTSATGGGAMTSATVGRQSYAGVPTAMKGPIYCVLAIKGTVSDADLAVLEKFVAQLSGVTL